VGGEYLGHGVHALVVLAGIIGVVVLLAPARRTTAPVGGHEVRVKLLRERVAAGTLITAGPLPDRIPQESLPVPTGRRDVHSAAVLVTVVASASAAGVHAAVTPGHAGEGLAVGLFFLLVALAQSAWACAVLLRPERPLLVAGIVLNLGVAAVWALSRTTGIPFVAAGRPEAVGVLDLAATGWELVLVACCLGLLRGPVVPRPPLSWHRWPYAARCWAALSIGVLGAVTVLDLHY
jgi:hypothetical protein